MTQRELDIDNLLETSNDRGVIPSIFNYCNRRCERCPFEDRCALRANERRDKALHPHDDWRQRVQRSFEQTIELLKRWCEREGVEPEQIMSEAPGDADCDPMEVSDRMRQHPLQTFAEAYTFSAMKLVDALRRSQAFNTWPAEAQDALDTVEWYGFRVASKTHRALTGFALREDDDDADWVQSDWNGSAKVARLEIRESRDAWEVLLRSGGAAADSPLRGLITHLDQLDGKVADTFPQAMAFVRPGFDEPERA